MNYKLLQGYPPYKIGDILTPALEVGVHACEKYPMDNRLHIPTKIIEEAPMYFQAISEESKYVIWIDNKGSFSSGLMVCKPDFKYGKIFNIHKEEFDSTLFSNWDNFLSKEKYGHNFREVTKSELEAHKLGFHLGDSVWYTQNHTEYSKGDYIGKISDFSEITGCAVFDFILKEPLYGIGLYNLTTIEPKAKIITEEGDKVYGIDECWFVCDISDIFTDSNYSNWTGNSLPTGKYFTIKENAELYFAAVKAIKRDIENGTHIFLKSTSAYFGQVSSIFYEDDLVCLKLDNGYIIDLDQIITEKEILKEIKDFSKESTDFDLLNKMAKEFRDLADTIKIEVGIEAEVLPCTDCKHFSFRISG